MSVFALPLPDAAIRFRRVAVFAAFAAIALSALTMTFWFFYRDTCSSVAFWKFCQFSRHIGERALAVLVLSMIYGLGRRDRIAGLLHAMVGPGPTGGALLCGGLGIALAVAPAGLVGHEAQGTALLAALVAWAAGVTLAAASALRILAPWSIWAKTARDGGVPLAMLMGVGLALPELGDLLFPLWHLDAIRNLTFAAVIWTSEQMGLSLVQGGDYVLGQDAFAVQVGQSCSGIEGFVMISVFLTGYALLFWRQLSLGRVLAILPLGLALSWGLNVLRISVLIWLGVNVSPTLAVEGFHSHAGWLLFSVLALGLIALIHTVPWFHARALRGAGGGARATAPLPPFFEDWNVARILPFAVFMFSALIASTFFQHPALAYPVRLALMVAVLWMFRQPLRALEWRVNAWAIGAGGAIGVLWLLTAPVGAGRDLALALTGLGGAAFAAWVMARTIGTTLAVPIIEELFFRSYLFDRLGAGRSPVRTLVAVFVSTAGFAVLHDRWLAAGLAGLVFAGLALRPGGRLTDAILAHVVANAVIAAAAIARQNWGLL